MYTLIKEFNLFYFISLFFLCSFFWGCSGLEQSEEEKLRQLNAKGEFIHRQHDDYHYQLASPEHYIRGPYPWEKRYAGKHPQITKEYFRCKGSNSNPPHVDVKNAAQTANYFDCGGFKKHSLPMREGQEFIYPALLDLLNYVQEKTGCKVVVTCGHRCPVHNAYADSAPENQNSKHMIGAEVDFYVQGMEHKPEVIIDLIMGYYQGQEESLRAFQRLTTGKWSVETPPWANKEIVIKLYQKHEGRDFDNRHPYPYLSLQVRKDRSSGEKVICDRQKAFNSYQRY